MWPNPRETVDSATFTQEIVNGKLHFLGSVRHATTSPVIVHQNRLVRYSPRVLEFSRNI